MFDGFAAACRSALGLRVGITPVQPRADDASLLVRQGLRYEFHLAYFACSMAKHVLVSKACMRDGTGGLAPASLQSPPALNGTLLLPCPALPWRRTFGRTMRVATC